MKKITKSKLIILCSGIMLAAALVFSITGFPSFSTSTGNDPEVTPAITGGANTKLSGTPTATPTPTATSTPTPTPTNTPTPTPIEPFVLSEDEEVTGVVEGYFKARLKGTSAAISPYVNNIENVNLEYIQLQFTNARSADNFKIYTVSGRDGLAYYALVVYDLTIAKVDTPSCEASIIQLVYSEPDENGNKKLLVNTDTLTDEQRDYQNSLMTHDDFLELYYECWQINFEKLQNNKSYATVWYNLFVSKIEGFKTTYSTADAFITHMKEEGTLTEFLTLRSQSNSPYDDDAGDEADGEDSEEESTDTED